MARKYDMEEQGDERDFPNIDPADLPSPTVIDPTLPGRTQGPEKMEPEPDDE
jgi:hypothetical protein